jgi:hypothetical protein
MADTRAVRGRRRNIEVLVVVLWYFGKRLPRERHWRHSHPAAVQSVQTHLQPGSHDYQHR